MTATDDALARFRTATAEMDTALAEMSRIAIRRAEAVRDAVDSGLSQADVARALGLSRNRVGKILAQLEAA